MTASLRESADSTRIRLLEGALACMRATGTTRLTFTDVSRAAGIARQTVYAYFPDRDALLHETVSYAALQVVDRIARETEGIADLAEAVVEITVGFHEAARGDVALRQVIAMTLHPGTVDAGTISAQAMGITRGFLRPRLASADLERIDEIAEVLLRFLLSVLGYRSAQTETPERLRAFLHRTLVPALGLAPASGPLPPTSSQESP